MKKYLILLYFIPGWSIAQNLEKMWESDTTLTTPESVLYDEKNNCLYVSCINGTSVPENNNSFIAKLGLDGKVQQRFFTTGLNAVKGMGLLNDKLYTAAFYTLVEIDVHSGKILNKYEVPGAKMLNDITVDPQNQVVYVTDMRGNSIWKLQNGKLEKIFDGSPLVNPNGLFYENGSLLIGNGDGVLYSLHLRNLELKKIAEGMARESRGIDGIEANGKGGYFVTEWSGRIWNVAGNGEKRLLIDSGPDKINTADIDYISSKKLLLVPTFFHNRVMAYKVK